MQWLNLDQGFDCLPVRSGGPARMVKAGAQPDKYTSLRLGFDCAQPDDGTGLRLGFDSLPDRVIQAGAQPDLVYCYNVY